MKGKGRRVMRRVRDNEKEVKSKPEFTEQSGLGRKSQDLDSMDMLPLQCDGGNCYNSPCWRRI